MFLSTGPVARMLLETSLCHHCLSSRKLPSWIFVPRLISSSQYSVTTLFLLYFQVNSYYTAGIRKDHRLLLSPNLLSAHHHCFLVRQASFLLHIIAMNVSWREIPFPVPSFLSGWLRLSREERWLQGKLKSTKNNPKETTRFKQTSSQSLVDAIAENITDPLNHPQTQSGR